MITVAFFSNKAELDFLRQRLDFDQLKLVALTPEADFCAHDYELNYQTTEDYYDEKELNIKGVKAHSTIEKICDTIDFMASTAEDKFTAHDLFFFVKLLYDQLLINHTFCQEVYVKKSPDKVILINVPPLENNFFVDENHDLLLNTILYFFQSKNIICEINSVENLEIAKENYKFLSFHFFRKLLSGFKKALLDMLNLDTYYSRKPRIYIAQHWDFEICRSLRKYYKIYKLCEPVMYFGNIELAKISSKEDINQHHNRQLNDLFHLGDISYGDLISSKITYMIRYLQKVMHPYIEKKYQFFKKKKIQAIIAASGQSLEVLSCLRAARHLGIPIIWGQHGGLYTYGDFPIAYYLNKIYSHYLLYTDPVVSMGPSKPTYLVSNSNLLAIYRAARSRH